jgi:hypothetical protein
VLEIVEAPPDEHLPEGIRLEVFVRPLEVDWAERRRVVFDRHQGGGGGVPDRITASCR